MEQFYQSLLVYSQIKKWQSWVLGIRKDCYIESGELMKNSAERFEQQCNIVEAEKCYKLYIAINKEYIKNINISFDEEYRVLTDINNAKLWISRH